MEHRGTTRNMDSLPENLSVAFPSPEGSDTSPSKVGGEGGPSPSTTPRKNKRKMTEPKKRQSDFSIKRFCPDSPRRDEVKEREVQQREYPPDTPEASPSPDSSASSTGGLKSHLMKGLLSEATPREDVASMSAYPLNIPMVPMPLTVTPPVTPRSKGAEDNSHGQKGVLAPQPITPKATRTHTDHSLAGILSHHRMPPHPHMLPPNLPAGMVHHLPPSPSSSESTIPTPNKRGPSSSTTSSPPSTTSSASKKSQSSVPPPSSSSQSIPPPPPPTSEAPSTSTSGGTGGGRRQRKNYKNMTRERRVEANARERTRVHTISAAFESLRRAVPSYSYNQRLSKLAILKIACSYIMALSQLTDKDYTQGTGDNPAFAQCVDRCTQTIQAEGRTKRRH